MTVRPAVRKLLNDTNNKLIHQETNSLSAQQLKRSLTPLMVWGLGVGYVISGMYFGWNLGLEKGGTLGLAVSTSVIIVMYVTFTFSYAELACAIPRAGGVFDYATRAFGRNAGFIAGMAQNVEFVFAPPAIAFAIGAYFNLFLPEIPVVVIAIVSYVLFTALNIYGVRAAALFELVITLFAVAELLLFAGITLPHFSFANLKSDALPNGWAGVFASIPFAIWFFLGIEGIANVAEESLNPRRTIFLGFGSAILTLICLCVITFLAAIGVAGWKSIVFTPEGATSDSPLPLALSHVVGTGNAMYHLLVTVGLFGLVASFHGLILAAGRSTFEFGRVGCAPAFLGRVHRTFKTPANALLANMLVGIIALLTGRTAEIITIAVFGALSLYIIASLSVLRLRAREPQLERPFKVPLYPWFPLIALLVASVSFVALIIYNPVLFGVYFILVGGCFAFFRFWLRKRDFSP